jgi:hypothetical protein
MARAMRREEPEEVRPSALELLGDELGRRDLRVTLAPAADDVLVLEAIRPMPTGVWLSVTARRIRWHDGAFWMDTAAIPDGEMLPADIKRAASAVAAALSWPRQVLRLMPPSGST